MVGEKKRQMEKEKVTEHDYKMVPLEDTPENRRKAVEAMEEAIKLAEKLRKKYENTNKTI